MHAVSPWLGIFPAAPHFPSYLGRTTWCDLQSLRLQQGVHRPREQGSMPALYLWDPLPPGLLQKQVSPRGVGALVSAAEGW